jgi:hypothetical protein
MTFRRPKLRISTALAPVDVPPQVCSSLASTYR